MPLDEDPFGIGSALQYFGADDYPMPTTSQAYLGSGDQEGDYPMPTTAQRYLGSGDQEGDYPMPTNPQTPGAFSATNWDKLLKGLMSPAGIAGLGGAALGYLDRPKPTGGGTTMAYPGAAKLERKMVQGPYGPLAEYTGVGGGAPDYTPFTAPTFGAPDVGGRAPTTPAPSPGAGMSVQSKVDLYKQLAGYGLGADRIRRIAETFYGPQTDTDWAELTRLAGVGTGIAAPAPKPGGITTSPAPAVSPAPPGGVTAPNVGPVVMGGPSVAVPAPAPTSSGFNTNIAGDYITQRKGIALPGGGTQTLGIDAIRKQIEAKYGPQTQAQMDAYEKAYKEHMAYLEGKPTGIAAHVKDYSPEAKAATYENYLARGWTEKEIRDEAEKQFGPQKESDWAELQRLASILPDDLLPKTGKTPTDIETEKAVADWKAKQTQSTTPAPAPVSTPTSDMSEGYRFATQPGGIGEDKFYENIANFIKNNPDPVAQKQAQKEYGISDADVYRAKMKYNLLGDTGFYAQPSSGGFARGGIVQMEDGGFVLTKRAVDGAGGPRGIAQLVPGARLIRGPGTGTSDSIPATIQGRHGQTPAKVSNGEAYVPKRFVQAQGGPQRMYALMNKLQRKA